MSHTLGGLCTSQCFVLAGKGLIYFLLISIHSSRPIAYPVLQGGCIHALARRTPRHRGDVVYVTGVFLDVTSFLLVELACFAFPFLGVLFKSSFSGVWTKK